MLRLENINIHEDLSEVEVVKEACRKYKLDYQDEDENMNAINAEFYINSLYNYIG